MPALTEHTRQACTQADRTLDRARGGIHAMPDDPGIASSVAVEALVAVADQLRALRLVVTEHGDDR